MVCDYRTSIWENVKYTKKFLDYTYPTQPKTSCSADVIGQLIDTAYILIKYKYDKMSICKFKSQIVSFTESLGVYLDGYGISMCFM